MIIRGDIPVPAKVIKIIKKQHLSESNHEVLATVRNHIMLTMILQHELSDSEACSANGSKPHRNPEGQAKRSKSRRKPQNETTDEPDE